MTQQSNRLLRSVQRYMPVFEAAARHGSLTLAGNEVGLTQSAVSRQIKALEVRLGRKLFRRAHKQISLNETGEKLYRAYSFAARHLEDAVEDIIQEKSKKQIVLSTSVSNAAFLLMPRVSEVRNCFPGGEIFVVTSDPQGIDPSENVDISLIFGKPDFPGMKSTPLFRDLMTPVCSPDYIEKHGPIESLQDLLPKDLLYMQAQHPSWIGWRRWFREFSMELPGGSRQLGFNNYYHVIQACVAGQGIALGWLKMLSEQFDKGQLIAPLAERIETKDYYHLAYPTHKPLCWDLAPFYIWLMTEIGGVTVGSSLPGPLYPGAD